MEMLAELCKWNPPMVVFVELDFTSKLSNFWNHHWGDCTNKSGFQKHWFSSAMFLQFQINQTTITTPRSQQLILKIWFSTTFHHQDPAWKKPLNFTWVISHVPMFHITQPLGIWSTRWLLCLVMSNSPTMGHLPIPVSGDLFLDLLTWPQGQRIGVQKDQAFVARQAEQQELGPVVDGANATYRMATGCATKKLVVVCYVVKTIPKLPIWEWFIDLCIPSIPSI